MNVPWVKFAGDVPNPDVGTFSAAFKRTHDSGGRIVRWWFHVNGTVTPGYQTSGPQAGMARVLPQAHIDGVRQILSAAHEAGIGIVMSLWSFDMLHGGEDITPEIRQGNTNFLTVDSYRQAYITNYLEPLVVALKGNPGLYSYEIFNEPEGMSPTGWTVASGGTSVPEAAIQRTVNWLAAAIHSTDPTALVTNGTGGFQNCSNIQGSINVDSDATLRAAGGKQNGTLDFYEVHYYASQGSGPLSPFTHPASYWKLDKKVVLGEFYAADTDGVAGKDTFTHLAANGYDGAWGWAYDPTLSAIETAEKNLYMFKSALVDSCP